MMMHAIGRLVTRRGALFGLTVGATLGRTSLALAQAATDRRLVVVLLRGGMDGLAAVVPYGDPDLIGLRAPLVPPPPGQPGGMLDLDGFFALHPALPNVHQMYQANEALLAHAVAGPYRSRSHFDAQDLMEAGTPQRLPSGWLNRLAGLLPAKAGMDTAVAIGGAVPPLLRGAIPVSNWSPPLWAEPTPDLYARLIAVHKADPVTGPALAEGLKERGFTRAVLAGAAPPPNNDGFTVLADRAGRMLAAPDGPRLAALETEGWDTHGTQPPRISYELRRLDAGLAALKTSLGEVWRKTIVLIITEFGRTARVNGSGGTDHGTGSVALLLGGPVAGGKVLADWPGLAPTRLFEDRDLRPTLDVRSLAKGVLAGHFGLREADLGKVFPDSAVAAPVAGMLRG